MEAEKQKNHKEMERLASAGEMMISGEEMALSDFDKPPDMIPEGSEDEGIHVSEMLLSLSSSNHLTFILHRGLITTHSYPFSPCCRS